MRLTKKVSPTDFEDTPTSENGFGVGFRGLLSNEPMRVTAHIKAVIGPKIHLRGQLSGEEDLLIEGRVEGKIELKNHHLTVGARGDIKANIKVQDVTISGTILGDVEATKLITAKSGSTINGNLIGPRVQMEDGAKFHGRVDMDSNTQ